MSAPRVVIADSTPFVRLAVRRALASGGIDVVAEVADGPAALRATLGGRIDVLLIEEAIDPDLAVVRETCRTAPGTAVIVLASEIYDDTALAAVRAGACGYLPKATSPDRLAAIVMGAIDGEAAIPRRIVRRLLGEIGEGIERDEVRGLSERERQVLDLLAQGVSDRAAGERLALSDVTVRRHAGTAMRKLRVDTRGEAIERYRESLAQPRLRAQAETG